LFTPELLAQAKARELPVQKVCFDYANYEGVISILEPLVGKTGWITLSRFTVESLDQSEDHLIFGAVTDDGVPIEEEAAARMFTLSGMVTGPCQEMIPDTPETATKKRQNSILHSITERNAQFFEAEAGKLEGWADDLKLGLERDIKDMDRQIKEARRAATIALTLEEKLAGQKQIKALEIQRSQKRRSLFDAQDQVDKHRDDLIATIEGKLTQKSELKKLFAIRWKLE